MRFQPILLGLATLGLLGAVPGSLAAQDFDLSDIFSNDRYYEEHGILQAGGDVGFLADAWYLPGTADSVRMLIGISLSNSALQFVRTTEGQWQAHYRVTAQLSGDDLAIPDREWEKTIEVSTFDETMLTGETIIFQTEMSVLPGNYRLGLAVHDVNGNDTSRVASDIDVPDLGAEGPIVSDPILLRLYQEGPSGVDYVVHPSHYYSTTPARLDFMVDLARLETTTDPYSVSAHVVSTIEGVPDTLPIWTQEIRPDQEGSARVFGSIQDPGASFGEYELVVALAEPGGNEIVSKQSPLLVAASAGWIADNWEDALQLIRYEALKDERKILEEIENDIERVQAWNCFWEIRDPVPATAANEAMQEYFRRLQIANANWSSALRRGFLSDRGRVYITLGSPNDIVQRPVPPDSPPIEVWRYDRNNFEIVFVDRIGFNNYQLENVDTYNREVSFIDRRKIQFLRERASACPLLEPAYE